MAESRDEFYVGYLPQAPAGIARRVRAAVVALAIAVVVTALVLVGGQKPFAPSHFEFLTYRDFEGRVELQPHALLVVERPFRSPTCAPVSRYYLVQRGKWGAGPELAALAGRRVRLRGSLLYLGDQTMIELVPGSIEPLEPPPAAAPEAAPAAAFEDLGLGTVRGEIVDSKCYFGAMNPGHGKPHRACAARCISGGIPAVLAVPSADAPVRQLLLVGADGRSVNAEIRAFVAETVEIRGRVLRYDDLYVLRAEPSTYRRVFE